MTTESPERDEKREHDLSGDGHGHHRDDGHDHHGPVGDESPRRLALVAGINLVGFFAEVAGGLLFGSVALLSDAAHMLFDALAYVMAFAAARAAANYETTERWSYGLHRLEPLSAFLNGVLLFPMVAFILFEAYQRFLDPVAIAAAPTIAVAAFGLAANLTSVLVLNGGEMNLNERGAFYHLLGDAGASVAVIVSTVVVALTGIRLVDPAVAVLIAVLVTWSALGLLRGSGAIFLQRAPVTRAEIVPALRELPGVEAVPDFHSWQVCSEITIATVRVETTAESMAEAERLTRGIHATLEERGVAHATVELRRDRDEVRLGAHGH